MTLTTQQYSISETDKKIIGSRFKTFRNDTIGIDQSDLALEIGSTQKTISFIENGHTLPNHKIITHLSKKYNLNPDWLISGKGDPKSSGKKDIDHKSNVQARLSILEAQVSGLQEMIKGIMNELKK